jgi:hypothetical protein
MGGKNSPRRAEGAAMSEKEGTLRMMPSGRWAVCRPGCAPVEITSGELFRVEVAGDKVLEFDAHGIRPREPSILLSTPLSAAQWFTRCDRCKWGSLHESVLSVRHLGQSMNVVDRVVVGYGPGRLLAPFATVRDLSDSSCRPNAH